MADEILNIPTNNSSNIVETPGDLNNIEAAQPNQVVETPKVSEVDVYDISGKEPVLGKLPADQVHDAIASGRFSLPQGEIQVVNPEGQVGILPADQAKDAFNAGFRYATPDVLEKHHKEQVFGTPTQQAITAVEAAGRGFLGPLAPLAEKALGVSPESIKAREEVNPVASTLGEVAGFGAGMLTGTGEAALLEKAGLKVAGAIENRIAQQAAKMATEMALLQAGNETTKYILDAPVSVGSSIADIGLSGLIGGATGGALTGTGALISKGLEKAGLKKGFTEFKDKLTSLMKGENPAEAIHKEVDNALSTFSSANDDIFGVQGIKAQAFKKVMPEMSENIIGQANSIATKGNDLVAKLQKDGVPERYIKKLSSDIEQYQASALKGNATTEEILDATQDFKKTLQNYSKGKWGEEVLPAYHEAHDFVNATKTLGREVRLALEDSKVWGEVADVQKGLNKAFSEAMPGIKDIKNKFTSKVSGESIVDPAKIESYLKQGGRSTDATLRQKMVEEFLPRFERYQVAVDKIYAKAGIENPHSPVVMSALKESLNKPSAYAKAAEAFYNKGMSEAGATALGSTVGGLIGEKSDIPGAAYVGVLLGGKLGASFLPGILQPMIEKAISIEGLQKAVNLSKEAVAGRQLIINGAKDIFKAGAMSGVKYGLPDHKELEKLDKQVTQLSQDPSKLLNATNHASYYLPNNGMEVTAATGRAVQYLASLKPQIVPSSPFDTKREPTKQEMAVYNRQLAIAENPLSVMKHIKDGTLQPQDIVTLKTISPGLYSQMANNIHEQLLDAAQAGETVPYNTRQSLSLFLGMPLDSTLTPQGILGAQATFISTPQAQSNRQAPTQVKKNTSAIGKTNSNYQTPLQAANEDRSSRS